MYLQTQKDKQIVFHTFYRTPCTSLTPTKITNLPPTLIFSTLSLQPFTLSTLQPYLLASLHLPQAIVQVGCPEPVEDDSGCGEGEEYCEGQSSNTAQGQAGEEERQAQHQVSISRVWS